MTKTIEQKNLGRIVVGFTVVLYIVYKIVHTYGNASIDRFQKQYHQNSEYRNQIQKKLRIYQETCFTSSQMYVEFEWMHA